MTLLDSDGAFAHYADPGNMLEQPYIDMEIYKTIRGRWVELKNEEAKAKYGK